MADVMFAGVPIADVNTSVRENFHHLVDEVVIPRRKGFQRFFKKRDLMIALVVGRLWNEDYQSRMHLQLGMLLQEITSVQRHGDIVVGNGVRYQIPVLPTALSDEGHIFGVVPSSFRGGYQRSAQTFVDQKAVPQRMAVPGTADFQSAP